MSGSIIVFSGMDGAGKSTQIDSLRDELLSAGRRPVTLWSRGGYTPGMNLVKSLMRRGSAGKVVPASGPSDSRTQAFQRPVVRRTWLSLAIVDLILLYGVWLRLQTWMGRDVICDRYLEDTALDFQINFPQESVSDWWLWRVLRMFRPRPDFTFLLLISVDESQRRSKLKDEPFPDSPEVLATRLEAYQEWARASGSDEAATMQVIDGLRPIEDVSKVIRDAVLGEHKKAGEMAGNRQEKSATQSSSTARSHSV